MFKFVKKTNQHPLLPDKKPSKKIAPQKYFFPSCKSMNLFQKISTKTFEKERKKPSKREIKMQMKAFEVGSAVEHFTQRGMRKNINNETEKKRELKFKRGKSL
ncbi:hypothetical protein ACKWTF_014904 [Chironomus riparius]